MPPTVCVPLTRHSLYDSFISLFFALLFAQKANLGLTVITDAHLKMG